jgi:hypothetical protein
MTSDMYYAKAPITEAIIDLRYVADQKVESSSLNLTQRCLLEGFPRQDELYETISEMEVGPEGGSASVKQTSIG